MLKPRRSDPTLTDEEKELLHKHVWMIRPCSVYIQEHSVCKGPRSRFDQYYIEGKLTDCSRWMQDKADCRAYTKEGDFKAGVRVIKNELNRLAERSKSFHDNDIMKERKTRPPPNWNQELPHYIEEKHEGSYLSEHLEDLERPFDYKSPYSCVIS